MKTSTLTSAINKHTTLFYQTSNNSLITFVVSEGYLTNRF